jgi:exopolysaccharide biosynthesis protein
MQLSHLPFFGIFLFLFPLGIFGIDGISCKHFILEDKTLIHLVEIDPFYFNLILKEAVNEPIETLETIAERENALAAINGGFFFTGGNDIFKPAGILKIGDNWKGFAFLPRGAIGWSNHNPTVLFDRLLTKIESSGQITILPQSSLTNKREWQDAFYILGGTPLLVQNGELITDYSEEKTKSSFLAKKHPRSAIGVLENGHFIFLTVDGTRNFFFRNSGISIKDLALLMQNLGCRNALNLDGGGSSTLYFEGFIQNNPCGEFLDKNHHFVRKVSNAILVIPKAL